jgi:hypothetical protein
MSKKMHKISRDIDKAKEELKMLRVATINSLKKYYCDNFAEDMQDGTKFDNMVFDQLDLIMENYDENYYDDFHLIMK